MMMRPERNLRVRGWTSLLFATAIVTVAAFAHGGEDHGEAAPAPASTPGAESNQLTTYNSTGLFELLLKYPVPVPGERSTLRLYLADYATNRAIERATFALSFKPAGVRVAVAPTMVSAGIYDLIVEFPRDTVYNLVATVTAGERTDFLEVRNIYVGETARRFLAEHAPAAAAPTTEITGRGLPGWSYVLIAALLIGGALFVIVHWRNRAARTANAGDDGANVKQKDRTDAFASNAEASQNQEERP